MSKESLEIQIANRTIGLLNAYVVATTQEQKDKILNEIHDIDLWAYMILTTKNYDPQKLATRMEKAIKLNDYRPKNMSIVQLATSNDLDNISGDFDTFDPGLQKMFKNNEDPDKIRKTFTAGTANVYVLARQFSDEWIDRLNRHKDLTDAARNADDEHSVEAYEKLFNALAQDFYKEYHCHTLPKVITDWATADEKPDKKGWDTITGYHVAAYGITVPDNLPESEKKKIIAEAKKHPSKCPDAHPLSLVYININVARKAHPNKADFFYYMIGAFVHEMHHALDYQQPRQGALGPQITIIDNRIYIPVTKDSKEYHKSATEISSYEIEHELYTQLKNGRY